MTGYTDTSYSGIRLASLHPARDSGYKFEFNDK